MYAHYQKRSELVYRWLQQGQGRALFHFPIDLEPPFMPFFGHRDLPPPTYTQQIHPAKGLRKLLGKKDQTIAVPDPPYTIKPFPFDYADSLEVAEFEVRLEKDQVISAVQSEQLLIALSTTQAPIAFEIFATAQVISVIVTCRPVDAVFVESQLKVHLPQAHIIPHNRFLIHLLSREKWRPEKHTLEIELAPKHEFIRPLYMPHRFDFDPLAGVLGLLHTLEPGTWVLLQILFQGVHPQHSWDQQIIRTVRNSSGEPFFADAPEMLALADTKASKPLFAASVRLLIQENHVGEAKAMLNELVRCLYTTTRSEGNSLQPLSQEGYSPKELMRDIYFRQSRRLGFLLNSSELVNMVHPPHPSSALTKLYPKNRKTKAAPDHLVDQSYFVFGTNVHHGKPQVITLDTELRRSYPHMHVIGASGVGKSTLLHHLIVSDIIHDHAVVVFDPHGDLISDILPHIPDYRMKDVILFDLSDTDYPIGLNLLQGNSPMEQELIRSDFISILRRFILSWGDRIGTVLGYAIDAFLSSSREGTLMDLYQFLTDAQFRNQFVQTVSDPMVRNYWEHEFALKAHEIAPITNRLTTFLRSGPIRNIMAQKKGLDFAQILNENKIFLVSLPKGLVGKSNSYLLGSLMMLKLQQATLSRQALAQEARRDVYIYIDEFQNFLVDSLEETLSESRKYRVFLHLAHQNMQQLSKEREIAESVLANTNIKVAFRLSPNDARQFQYQFSGFNDDDLQSLGIGEAVARIGPMHTDFSINTVMEPSVDKAVAANKRQQIIEQSRSLYATPRSVVEAEIQARYKPEESSPQKEKKQAGKREKSTKVSEHQYLQQLIKQTAETFGYRAELEAPTSDGGRVDVSLTKGDQKIACEVAITNTPAYEVKNIQKCLKARYSMVFVCSQAPKHLKEIEYLARKKLSAKQLKQVQFLPPEQLFAYLAEDVSDGKNMAPLGYEISSKNRQEKDQHLPSPEKQVEEMLRRFTKKPPDRK